MINKKNSDLISIVIPVYNTGKYLEKCLDSVLKQTYKNIEIIIINDGSVDNSEDIIMKYKKLDKRIQHFKNEKNMGVSFTRNRAIDISKGKYIYFLDSDDYITPNCIETLYNTISPNDTFSCMTKAYAKIDGELILYTRNPEEIMLMQSPSVCVRLFNKKIILESGIRFPDLKIAEDLEFVFKLIIYNNKASFTNEALYTYLIRRDSSIRTLNNNQLDTIKALEAVEKYAKEIKKYDEFHETIEFASVSHILHGTIKRLKLCGDEKNNEIKKCFNYVNQKYPNWKLNKYVIKYFSKTFDL